MSETIKTVLESDSSNLRAEFARAQGAISQFHSRFTKIAGALAGSAVFASAISGLNSLRNSIDSLQKQALKLEIPVEELQRLNAVAELGGTSAETLAKGLAKARISAVDAAKGSGELAAQFKVLNISAESFQRMGATEQLLAISSGFNSATDRAAAFAAITKIMGKSARELIPVLKDGEAGIESISRRLKVFGQEDADQVAKLNDEISLLSANLTTGLGKAAVSLTPQIKSIVAAITEAAEGLSVFLDPASGVGSQGGVLGGAAMLREMDQLKASIAEATANPAKWYEGPARQKTELRASAAALATLEARYAGLSDESRVYAEQIREIERLRNSGLSEEVLGREMLALQARTAETMKGIEAERALATASVDTAVQMDKQATAAAAMAKSLESLKEKVGSRILAAQPPEKREEMAKSALSNILTREKAGSIGEIRDRVNTAANPEDQLRALKSLNEWLDRQQDLKRANEELAAAAQARQDEVKAGFDASSAAAGNFKKSLDGLYTEQVRAREEARDQASARADYSASVKASQLELAGRKDLADQLRQEVALHGQVADFARTHGVNEAEALRLLRGRLGLEERVKKLKEGVHHPGDTGGGGRGRGIRHLPNEANDMIPGNNMQNWRWNLGPSAPKVGLRSFEQQRRSDERSSRDAVPAAFTGMRDTLASMYSDQRAYHESMKGFFGKLGTV
jgi:hypothetical protein